MADKLEHILQRIDSRHLSKLWTFYRDYFKCDESCLDFIFCAVYREPVYSKEQLERKFSTSFENDDYVDPDDRLFIPRRMLNCVERMVSAARDMEQIRKGKDIFKIVFLISCVETLQKLTGFTGKKKDMLFDFFEGYTSNENKKYIRKHFAHGTQGLYPDEDAFWQFVSVLSEYRNAAAHEGQYWETCFKNYSGRTPLSIIVKGCGQSVFRKGDVTVLLSPRPPVRIRAGTPQTTPKALILQGFRLYFLCACVFA